MFTFYLRCSVNLVLLVSLVSNAGTAVHGLEIEFAFQGKVSGFQVPLNFAEKEYIDFQGTQVWNPYPAVRRNVQIGDTISGSFTFESETPKSGGAIRHIEDGRQLGVSYNGAIKNIRAELPSLAIQRLKTTEDDTPPQSSFDSAFPPSADIWIFDIAELSCFYPDLTVTDLFSVQADVRATLEGKEFITNFTLSIASSDTSMLSGSELPLSAPDPGAHVVEGQSWPRPGINSSFIDFELISLTRVPEPGTWLMIIMAIGSLTISRGKPCRQE